MMTPCCKATVNHPVSDAIGSGGTFPVAPVSDGILNYRNSPEMNQLRNDMLKQNPYTDLVKDVCRKCIYAEDHGLPEQREPCEHHRPQGRDGQRARRVGAIHQRWRRLHPRGRQGPALLRRRCLDRG